MCVYVSRGVSAFLDIKLNYAPLLLYSLYKEIQIAREIQRYKIPEISGVDFYY